MAAEFAFDLDAVDRLARVNLEAASYFRQLVRPPETELWLDRYHDSHGECGEPMRHEFVNAYRNELASGYADLACRHELIGQVLRHAKALVLSNDSDSAATIVAVGTQVQRS
ncbi:hypothetical protein [Nocardia sp. NPDC051832]|uniref:hypothetical protein n=1 Tax=Nocardia sp. NPDC051832 TaxID=3155673 RepID=UPI0034141C41